MVSKNVTVDLTHIEKLHGTTMIQCVLKVDFLNYNSSMVHHEVGNTNQHHRDSETTKVWLKNIVLHAS